MRKCISAIEDQVGSWEEKETMSTSFDPVEIVTDSEEDVFQEMQRLCGGLVADTRSIHEHLGVNPWVTKVLDLVVLLCMIVLLIWYFRWLRNWWTLRHRPFATHYSVSHISKSSQPATTSTTATGGGLGRSVFEKKTQ